MVISIIVCTRNRCQSLDQTLVALRSLEIPAGLSPEIVVVDNGSSDETSLVLSKHKVGRIPVRHITENCPGLARARNAGLAGSHGEVILFTDDDVTPTRNWLNEMAAPLVERKCDFAVGWIRLASELNRVWFTQQHRVWLAVTDELVPCETQLVGASMGFHRSVLDVVPVFDPELGAGALGYGEETLFSFQLSEAGFKFRQIPEAIVVHKPDCSRLLRSNWIVAARQRGASAAYILHHWEHGEIRKPWVRLFIIGMKLRLRRNLGASSSLDSEGIAEWEMSYIASLAKVRRFLVEREKPRAYPKRGLRKCV